MCQVYKAFLFKGEIQTEKAFSLISWLHKLTSILLNKGIILL